METFYQTFILMLLFLGAISFSLLKVFSRLIPWGGGAYYPSPAITTHRSQPSGNSGGIGIIMVLLVIALGSVLYSGLPQDKSTEYVVQENRTPTLSPTFSSPDPYELPVGFVEDEPPEIVVQSSLPIRDYSSSGLTQQGYWTVQVSSSSQYDFALDALEKIQAQHPQVHLIEQGQSSAYKIVVGNWETKQEAKTWMSTHPTVDGFIKYIEL